MSAIEVFHRGLRPEQNKPNSFDALTAVRSGDTIELDTVLLSDGTLAIIHPKDIGKDIAEVEKMNKSDFESLGQPKANSLDEKMPLLREVLFQLHDRSAKLFLELKASSPEKIKAVAIAVVNQLVKLSEAGAFLDPDFLQNSLILHTFSVEGVRALVESLRQKSLLIPVFLQWNKSEAYANQITISATGITHAQEITQTSDWTEKGMLIARNSGCAGIALHISVLIDNPGYIEVAHRHSLKIAGGGPINVAEKRRLISAGLDIYVE